MTTTSELRRLRGLPVQTPSTTEVLAWAAQDAREDAEYREFLDTLTTSRPVPTANCPTTHASPAVGRPTSPTAVHASAAPPTADALGGRRAARAEETGQAPSLADLDALLDEITDVEAQVAALHARRARLAARLGRAVAAMDGVLVDDADPTARSATRARRHELARRAAVAELATVLHVGEHAAGSVLDHAQTLTTRAPRTLAALAEGRLSWAHAVKVAGHVADLAPHEAAQVEAAVLPVADGSTPAQLAAAARRAREDAHPTPLDVRHADAAARRAVFLDDGRDGMAWLVAHLPAPLAHAAYDRLTRTASHLRDLPDEDRTRDQLHADTLAALLLDAHPPTEITAGAQGARTRPSDGPGHTRPPADGVDDTAHTDGPGPPARDPVAVLARGIRPRVNVTVPVLSLLGHGDAPALLDGLVPLDPETSRSLCALAPSFRRLLTHPTTGSVLAADPQTYAVPAGLKALLVERDRTCRFPGCTRPATRCDLDHTVAWARGGATAAGNLAHLCRHHHLVKHQTRWTVRQVPTPSPAGSRGDPVLGSPLAPLGGTLEWTSPTGRTYRTHPALPATTRHGDPPRVRLPDDVPDDPDPPF